MDIKATLNLMATYAYDEYLDFQKEGSIVDELTFDSGFVYVKDNGESYGIRISFQDDTEFDPTCIEQYLKQPKDRYYILMNGKNARVRDHYVALGFKEMYSAHEMHLNTEPTDFDKFPGIVEASGLLKLQAYDPNHFDDYIRILGSFAPMRESLNLEPYDWYGHHLAEAKEKFENHSKDENFFSYAIDGKLVAVAMLEKNEIDTIAVHRDWQKQGIGKKLLQTLIYILKERGYQEQFLSVMAINAKAQQLYESVGFRSISIMTILYK